MAQHLPSAREFRLAPRLDDARAHALVRRHPGDGAAGHRPHRHAAADDPRRRRLREEAGPARDHRRRHGLDQLDPRACWSTCSAPEAASKGRLRTKYIAPIYEDQRGDRLREGRVRRRTSGRDASTTLEVWCEDDKGKKLTVGERGRARSPRVTEERADVERSFRRAHPRPVARVRGAGRNADPRRPRRGRDQGRGAGPRRRGALLRRHQGDARSHAGVSPSFVALNRNKRSIAIDLASPAGTPRGAAHGRRAATSSSTISGRAR